MLSLEGQKRAIMSYITMKEGEGEYHKCTQCPRMYNSEDLLENHIQRKHSIEEETAIPREATNFGGVIQSTLQRRRDKTRQQSMMPAPAISAPGGSAGSGRAEAAHQASSHWRGNSQVNFIAISQ